MQGQKNRMLKTRSSPFRRILLVSFFSSRNYELFCKDARLPNPTYDSPELKHPLMPIGPCCICLDRLYIKYGEDRFM